jgi:hypothetical protein
MFVKNVGAIYRDLRNPRTGERFKSPTGLRDRVW